MDAILMMKTAAVLLAVAALSGVLMAVMRFGGMERPPASLAMLHGLLAAAALTLLIYFALTGMLPTMALAATAILVVVAAVGVGINLLYHSRSLPLPRPAIVVHGLVAAVGFALLVLALMGAH